MTQTLSLGLVIGFGCLLDSTVHCSAASSTLPGGEILDLNCFNKSSDWYSYEPELTEFSTVNCANKCYVDGFEFAGVSVVENSTTHEVIGFICECGCDLIADDMHPVSESNCQSSCVVGDSGAGFCPNSAEFISTFNISVEDPFCKINPICDVSEYDVCQQELQLVYGIVVAALVAVLIIIGLIVLYNRHKMCARCREHGRGSPRIKKKVTNGLLTDDHNSHELVQSVQQSWVIDFHKITMGKMIAAGSSGQVYAGDFEGKPVAVKELFSVLFDPEALKDFKDEVLAQCFADWAVFECRFFAPCSCCLVLDVLVCCMVEILTQW